MQTINERAFSISPEALIEKGNVVYSSVSGGGELPTTDSSIITLVAGVDISANELIGLSSGLAVLADYSGIPCIGIALDTVTTNNAVRVKVQGIVDVPNNTANEYYLGSSGLLRTYSYESGKYLQKIADKISDNQILLNISDFILML